MCLSCTSTLASSRYYDNSLPRSAVSRQHYTNRHAQVIGIEPAAGTSTLGAPFNLRLVCASPSHTQATAIVTHLSSTFCGTHASVDLPALRPTHNQDELQVLDMVFLAGCTKPTLCVLYQDAKDARHVRTYQINLQVRSLLVASGGMLTVLLSLLGLLMYQAQDQSNPDGPFSVPNVESGAAMLVSVPKPACGVIVIGEKSITYHNGPDSTVHKLLLQCRLTSRCIV